MNAIVTCGDVNYVRHAQSLFGQLRGIGKCSDDLYFISSCDEMADDDKQRFEVFGVKLISIPKAGFYGWFYKVGLFNDIFKKYKHVLYLDCDCVVTQEFNLDNAITDNGAYIYAEKEPFTLKRCMYGMMSAEVKASLAEDIKRVESCYTFMDECGYCAGMMLFANGFLRMNIKEYWDNVRSFISKVNYHCRPGPDASDQTVFNLAFFKAFRTCKLLGKIIIHSSGKKPWVSPAYVSSYKLGLNVFDSVLNEYKPVVDCLKSVNNVKVISMSLYGSHPMYLKGAVYNARLRPTIYPDWEMWIYVGDEISAGICNLLRALGCKVFHASKEFIGTKMCTRIGGSGMVWRFMAARVPGVEVMISRDADSRLNVRERAAVLDWLAGPKRFHSIRDHKHHKSDMMGGLWGVKGHIDLLPQCAAWNWTGKYGEDEAFVKTHLWSIACNDICKHGVGGAPFPSHPPFNGFVGQRYTENDQPIIA